MPAFLSADAGIRGPDIDLRWLASRYGTIPPDTAAAAHNLSGISRHTVHAVSPIHTDMPTKDTLPDAIDTRSTAKGSRELGARSLTTAVYERVRGDILSNLLAPGEKLHLATLQDQYGVSLSVIREALSRLVADGLVMAMTQRGFRVTPISKSDLIDVTRTRTGLECQAIELAIENGDKAWLESVERAFERMCQAAAVSGDPTHWTAAHAAFHQTLVEPCNSPWLMRFRATLFEQAERYRFLAVERERKPTAKEVRAIHLPLVEAVLKRDSTRAKAAIKQHFESTLASVMSLKGLD
jgi:DNA-binding GntR family transcriptional regulator